MALRPPLPYVDAVIETPPKVQHLYLHVPFCVRKCRCCAFYSTVGAEPQMRAYTEAVKREMAAVADDLAPRTIFWGGGTPSVLPESLTAELLGATTSLLPMDGLEEWTVEANPTTVSREKARLYLAHGVNRINLGVQAFDDRLLRTLGRVHTVTTAIRSYEHLRTAGFSNIGLDLMFGLPGQTTAMWEDSLRQAIALHPEHISTYCLILEEHTVFGRASRRGLFTPNEEAGAEMFRRGIEILQEAGYRHYEISNFAKPGREARHNIAYWRGRDYYGLGPSAFSTVRGRRWMNVADTARYVESVLRGNSVRENEESLSPLLRTGERAAFGIRMMEGLSTAEFKTETGFSLTELWPDEIAQLIDDGLLEWRDERLRLTRRGILFADTVSAAFVIEPAAMNRELPRVSIDAHQIPTIPARRCSAR